MSHLDELYQDVLIDHSKNPRNFGELKGANRHAEGLNPLCGDKIKLCVLEEDGSVKDVKFCGEGCAISKASASIMSELIKGKNKEEIEVLFQSFHKMLTEEGHEVDPCQHEELSAFSGVKNFPVRVKCATLCWHALNAAIKGDETATTEE
jgi:nitrogen fixation NifU-like protein